MSEELHGWKNLWHQSGEHFQGAERLLVLCDYAWCLARYGTTPSEYFMYQFYRKNGRERRTFLTRRDYTTTYPRINKADISILVNKPKFHARMKEFINRDWLYADENCTAADFIAFAQKHPDMIVKPITTRQGFGVWRLTLTGDEDLEALYNEKIKGSLVEERIIQHPALEKLAPGTVNSVRVVTLNYGDHVDIVGCTLKTGGNGSAMDNLHAGGGVGGSVDIETGVVFTHAKTWDGKPCINHPITGEQVTGFKVPNWDILMRRVREAAQAIPELPVIGWDCAITPDGVSIIEGNHDPGVILFQIFDQVGKRPVFRKFIKEKGL